MRAKVKAQAAPEERLQQAPRSFAPMPHGSGGKPEQKLGRFWSRLLIGGAMALLFSAGYLAVDRLIARGVRRASSSAATPNPQANAHWARPAPPAERAEHHRRAAAETPRTAKPEIAPTAPDDRRKRPAPPRRTDPAPQARDAEPTDLACRCPSPAPASRRAVAPQDPAAAALQDGQLAGAAPTIDALPTGIGSNALREAAVKGDPTAQFEIATRFAEGNGVPQDQKQAFAWYERAAMRGLASSQFRLGAYYERGIGVTADAERAKVWYRRAADQGHVRAMHNLGVLVAGRGQEQGDYAGASHWFKEAAKRGMSDSQFNLATLYAHGRGVPKDLVEVLHVVRAGGALRRRRFIAPARGDQGAARPAGDRGGGAQAGGLARGGSGG